MFQQEELHRDDSPRQFIGKSSSLTGKRRRERLKFAHKNQLSHRFPYLVIVSIERTSEERILETTEDKRLMEGGS